jgi:hypothetical protein
MKFAYATLAALAAAAFSPSLVWGDTLELANGDTLSGKVIAMDDATVKIQNEILGEISVPRDKVAAVILGDRPVRPAQRESRLPPRGAEAEDGRPKDWWRKYGETPEEIVENLAPKDFGPQRLDELQEGAERHGTPEEAVEQLRREGVPPGVKDQLQLLLPGFGTPQVQDYFDKTVDGLTTGSISLDDLRNDAIDANEQLKELQDDLGPSGKALDGYRAILENFIRRTRPKESSETPSAPPAP